MSLGFQPTAAIGEHDLRAMIEAAPALMSFFDRDHVCRFANHHHADWYGRDPAALIGTHMRTFLGEDAYIARLPFLARVAEGEAVAFEARIPHQDGGWRDAAIRYVPKIGAEGFEGLYILAFDVAVLQHRFHSVFDGTAVAFWLIDLGNLSARLAEGGATDLAGLQQRLAADPAFVRAALDDTPVLEINAKAAELFAISPQAARSQPFGRWCPTESLEAFSDNLLAYVAGEAFFETETVMADSQGQLIDVLLTCAFAKNAPGETAVVVGATDIRTRVAKEQALARAQADLAHAARVATLGELAASIAHEVNQPLAAVMANGNAARRWLNRPEPNLAEVAAAIDRVMFESNRAAEIIARTRAMAVKGEQARERFEITAMIEDTVDIVRRQVRGLGADLQLDLPATGLAVNADRIQIQQVLINLIINAAQAMSRQRGARRITVRAGERDGVVLVEVADNGPGFEGPGERLFEAFFTTKPTGMGMGLSVSRTIMLSHGGQIAATSDVGGGASFLFTLPAARGEP